MSNAAQDVKKEIENTLISEQEQNKKDFELMDTCLEYASYGVPNDAVVILQEFANRLEKIKSLVQQGANINRHDFRHYNNDAQRYKQVTPLFLLLRTDAETTNKANLGCVKFLIESKADINATNGVNQTPLMVSTIYKSSLNVEFLLKNKADVNAQDSLGWTALHYAVRDGLPIIGLTLLEAKASCTIMGEDCFAGMRETPYQYAFNVMFWWTAHRFEQSTVHPNVSRLSKLTNILDFWTTKGASGKLELSLADVEEPSFYMTEKFRLNYQLCLMYKQKLSDSNNILNFNNGILGMIFEYIDIDEEFSKLSELKEKMGADNAESEKSENNLKINSTLKI